MNEKTEQTDDSDYHCLLCKMKKRFRRKHSKSIDHFLRAEKSFLKGIKTFVNEEIEDLLKTVENKESDKKNRAQEIEIEEE